jgi:hypothetical protein
MRKILPTLILLLLPWTFLQAQNHENDECPCCFHNARQFDFLIGNWDVVDGEGKNLGTSEVAALLDKCAIQENWTNADGSQSGMSISYFDKMIWNWRYMWIDNMGNGKMFNVEYTDTAMYMMSDAFSDTSDSQARIAIVLQPNKNGTVSVEWQALHGNADKKDGMIKTIIFKATYVPRKKESAKREEVTIEPATIETKPKKKNR